MQVYILVGLYYPFFLAAPFPPTGVQLNVMFIDGNFSITATWMVSCNRTDNLYTLYKCMCIYACMHTKLLCTCICTYGTAQRQLDACMWVAGSAPDGDISTSMRVPAGIFPVSSKACL